MIKSLMAWFTGGRIVWLTDYDGELTRTIAYRAGGKMIARRMLYCTPAVLLNGGTVEYPSYVKYWEFE